MFVEIGFMNYLYVEKTLLNPAVLKIAFDDHLCCMIYYKKNDNGIHRKRFTYRITFYKEPLSI